MDYVIEATRTIRYVVPVKARNEREALDIVNDWNGIDFDEYETDSRWDYVVSENDEK